MTCKLYKILTEYISETNRWEVTLFYTYDTFVCKSFEELSDAILFATEEDRTINREEVN